jgi:hypothetical protein
MKKGPDKLALSDLHSYHTVMVLLVLAGERATIRRDTLRRFRRPLRFQAGFRAQLGVVLVPFPFVQSHILWITADCGFIADT